MYIDESGDTITLSQGGKRFLVLTGCVVDESDLQNIETKLREIKQAFYQNPSVEFKSNFLRYANPDLVASSPLKLKLRSKYNELEDRVTSFLQKIPVTVISIVIHKELYWTHYPSQDPYEAAYMFLLERFNRFLARSKSLGICIIDPREGQVEKHFMGNKLSDLHDQMRWSNNHVWKSCSNIVEKLLFSQSDQTIGIQIADLYCYSIYHLFEYNKRSSEYWRFSEITRSKLDQLGGKIDGIGLKFFPEDTKKDFKYYQT